MKWFKKKLKKEIVKDKEIRDLKASYIKELNKNIIINCHDIKRLKDIKTIKIYHKDLIKQKDIAIEILTNDLRVYTIYVGEYYKKGGL